MTKTPRDTAQTTSLEILAKKRGQTSGPAKEGELRRGRAGRRRTNLNCTYKGHGVRATVIAPRRGPGPYIHQMLAATAPEPPAGRRPGPGAGPSGAAWLSDQPESAQRRHCPRSIRLSCQQ